MNIKKNGDNLEISITVPLTITGTGTYGNDEWSAPGVVVYIDRSRDEFALYHTQYLDYKDSLQATSPIAFFDSEEEALKVAKEFGLGVEYAFE
jgi:hypothetical protein